MRINAIDGSVNITNSLKTPYLNPGFVSNNNYKYIRFGDSNSFYAGFMWNEASPTFGNGDDFTIFTYGNRDIVFEPSGTANTYFHSGNVGIGTTDPKGYKLAVKGNIGAEEIEVRTNYWADFVFDNDYLLRPLDQVENFIKENGHLPDVPSEKEAISSPLNLGEMNILLLQKVEELTLYTIDQNKISKEQLELINNQATIIKELDARLKVLENNK